MEELVGKHAQCLVDLVRARDKADVIFNTRQLSRVNREWSTYICVPDDAIFAGTELEARYRETIHNMIDEFSQHMLGMAHIDEGRIASFFCEMGDLRKRNLWLLCKYKVQDYTDALHRLKMSQQLHGSSKTPSFKNVAQDCIVCGKALGALLDHIIQ